jgi:hypothetical protein
MRRVLRFSMLLGVAGLAWSQAITDAAGVLAGGSVGVGAGKKVSEGVSAVLQKTSAATTQAAKTEKVAPVQKPQERAAVRPSPKAGDGGSGGGSASSGNGGTQLQVGPGGVVKDHSLVPPPPPKKVVAVVPPPPPLVPPTPIALQPIVALPPPPPPVTPDDLKTLASGTSRAEVLKLGAPSSRITMFDEGHLVEIFRYQTHETTFGVVRLSDGSVSSVQVR